MNYPGKGGFEFIGDNQIRPIRRALPGAVPVESHIVMNQAGAIIHSHRTKGIFPHLKRRQVCDFEGTAREFQHPFASSEEVKEEYGIDLCPLEEAPKVEAVVLATPHSPFLNLSPQDIKDMHAYPGKAILIDVKRILSRKEMQAEGIEYWGL